jgi:hypothetical protein
MKIEYNGQGVGTLLLEMVKQATGDERIPKSTHNQHVYKTLLGICHAASHRKNQTNQTTARTLKCTDMGESLACM